MATWALDKHKSRTIGIGNPRIICLSVLAFLLALVAFILTVIIWADPKLVPYINDNYYESAAETEAEPTNVPEPSEEPAPEPSAKLDFGYEAKMGQKDRVYTFGAFGAMPPFSFVDDAGYHRGYVIEVVSRLCREAGKNCRFIVLNTYRTVWDGALQISEGLLRRFFDAGVYVMNTPERTAGYTFTEPLFEGVTSSVLLIRKGASFVEDDLMTKKIGFIAGFYTSVECLKRETGKKIPDENVFTLTSVEEVVAAFEDGTIELAFMPDNAYDGDEMVVGKAIEGACSNGDLSMLVRKDSPLLGWMSDVTKQMKKSGQYKEMCDELMEKYNTTIPCAI